MGTHALLCIITFFGTYRYYKHFDGYVSGFCLSLLYQIKKAIQEQEGMPAMGLYKNWRETELCMREELITDTEMSEPDFLQKLFNDKIGNNYNEQEQYYYVFDLTRNTFTINNRRTIHISRVDELIKEIEFNLYNSVNDLETVEYDMYA